MTAVIYNLDIVRANYISYIFGLMVRPNGQQNSAFRFSTIRPSGFGLKGPPSLLFGLIVKFGRSVFFYSAVRFSIYSAFWIRPYGPVRQSRVVTVLCTFNSMVVHLQVSKVFGPCPGRPAALKQPMKRRAV